MFPDWCVYYWENTAKFNWDAFNVLLVKMFDVTSLLWKKEKKYEIV